MRQTTILLTEHILEQLALIVESYIIHVTKCIRDLAAAGHCELLDMFMTDQYRLDNALLGAVRSGSLTLVQHVIDCGAKNYFAGFFSACHGSNLDIAKLLLNYDYQLKLRLYPTRAHLPALGQYSHPVELFNWVCDVNPDMENIEITTYTAIESEDMRMLSAAVMHGASIRGWMYFAGLSGSLAMVVLASQYDKNYTSGFVGACYAGNLKLIKWFIDRGEFNFNTWWAFDISIEVFKYVIINVPGLDRFIEDNLLSYLHLNDESDYMRNLIAASGIYPKKIDIDDVVRWIVTELGDRINYTSECWRCRRAIGDHKIIKKYRGADEVCDSTRGGHIAE